MKFIQISSAVLALLTSGNGFVAASDTECREKHEKCQNRVRVNTTSSVFGLIDDVPKEVFEAFMTASTACLQCVDKASVQPLHSKDNKCKDKDCKGCGLPSEDKKNCKNCCGFCRCMGCDWNYGNDDKSTKKKKCDKCCGDNDDDEDDDDEDHDILRRRLSATADDFIEFKIDVCMDDVTPLDPTVQYYTNYEDMLADFQTELEECYENKEAFMSSWSSLTADAGIDLSLMARDSGPSSGGQQLFQRVMFGLDEIDTENVEVTVYDSSGSHRSTSHMMFYSALGFVTVAAAAVFGTALVVQILRKRREEQEAQASQWVSELTSMETVNPVGPVAEGSA